MLTRSLTREYREFGSGSVIVASLAALMITLGVILVPLVPTLRAYPLGQNGAQESEDVHSIGAGLAFFIMPCTTLLWNCSVYAQLSIPLSWATLLSFLTFALVFQFGD